MTANVKLNNKRLKHKLDGTVLQLFFVVVVVVETQLELAGDSWHFCTEQIRSYRRRFI